MRRLNQNRTIVILVAPALIFMVLFFVLPLAFLLMQSFQTDDSVLTLQGYSDFLTSRTSRIIYWRTLRMGLLITGICTLIAYPASFVIARMPTRRRTFLLSLVILPLMTNAIARTYAWLIILGRQGIINESLQFFNLIDSPLRLIFTENAIVLGLTQLFLPLMVLPLVSSMENIPEDVVEAARSLGANRLMVFFRIIVPMSMDGLVLGATLVFTGSVTAYVTPAILGGTRTLLLSTLLYQRAVTLADLNRGAVVAVVMILTTLSVNLLLRLLRR
ncbi:MAG: ABC transporter permease [Anaerolineae bacterium]|nr:ABC transporter permease [Anaerolineae bacterium]